MRGVTWSEKTLRAYEEIWIMFSPEHAATVLERILNARDCRRHSFNNIETAAHKERT